MKIKIERAIIKGKEELTIIKPYDKVIEDSELEDYRESLKKDESDSVNLQYKESEEE